MPELTRKLRGAAESDDVEATIAGSWRRACVCVISRSALQSWFRDVHDEDPRGSPGTRCAGRTVRSWRRTPTG